MNSRIERGQRGEEAVCAYLKTHGYCIRERNYRFGRSEVDIIAQSNEGLAFVEVKTRTGYAFGAPAEAVTRLKCRKLTQAAYGYLAQNGLHDTNVTFDIAEVLETKKGFDINYIKNAFAEVCL